MTLPPDSTPHSPPLVYFNPMTPKPAKQASIKSAVFPELAKPGQITVG